MPTPQTHESREHKTNRKLRALVGILVALGCFYTAGSVVVMYDLYAKNVELCTIRKTSRVAIRTMFVHRTDWTVSDQEYMDKNFPAIVNC